MRNKRRIPTSLVLTVNLLSALVAFSSFSYLTIAWFNMNRQKSVQLRSVEVSTAGLTVDSFDTYGVISLVKDQTTTEITFVNNQINEVPRYDPAGIEYGRYLKAIVVHVQFTYVEAAPVTFYATTLNEVFSTGTPGDNPFDDNVTSNVFQLTPSSGTILSENWTETSLSYSNANTQSFVTIGQTPSKVTSLELSTINPGDTEFWFVLEYNPVIMDFINNERMNNDHEVIYQDDIIYMVAP